MTSAPNHPVLPDLAGKAVLVTGGSTGIGAALVEAYAAQKCRVGLHYNQSLAAAEALAWKLRDGGADIFLVKGDFSKAADVSRVVEETATHFGGLDGLVNNAGGMLGRIPYAELTEEQYDAVMDLNARSVVTASRVAIPSSPSRAASSSTPRRSPRATALVAARGSTARPRPSSPT